MPKIKLTAKRQATLPAAVCEELGVSAGDTLSLERRLVEGEAVWILRSPRPDWSWYGAARAEAEGASHDMSSVRESIRKGRSGGRRS